MNFVTALQKNLSPIPKRVSPSPEVANRETSAVSPGLTTGPTADKRKIDKAARQFETQLLTSLLAGLQRAMGSVPGGEESGEGEQYKSMATQSLASAWTAAGGIGLSRILTEALSHASQPKGVNSPTLPPDQEPAALPAGLGKGHSSFLEFRR